jgi:hypothetical protein
METLKSLVRFLLKPPAWAHEGRTLENLRAHLKIEARHRQMAENLNRSGLLYERVERMLDKRNTTTRP